MAETVSFMTNAAELAARQQLLADRLEDPSPVLERARRLFAAQESAVWQTEGATIGEHWAQAAEPDRKVDSRLLVATGRLRASLTGASAGRVQGNELRLGTDVPYGVFHQYGTSKMPARPFLGVSDNAARATLALLQQEVEGRAVSVSPIYPVGNFAEVGPMVSGYDVEAAVEATLREWLAPYLAECDDKHGFERGSTATPRGWGITGRDLQKLNTDQLPCVVIMAGGVILTPSKMGGNAPYTAFFAVDIGAVFNAAWGRDSRRHAQFYAAAIRSCLIQRPLTMGDVAFASVDWRGEVYDEMDFADSRSYSASVVSFNVEVRNVADANGGPPPQSSAPVDPTQPFTPWIDVVETSVTVTNTPPDGT